MADDSPQPARARRNWTRVALALSLALNLLVAGMIAGALLNGARDRDRNPAMRDLGYGPFVEALPRADRRALARDLAREAGAFRENRARMRQAFESLLTALRAEPYDPEAVRRLIYDQQARVTERLDLGLKLLVDRLNGMDAAERAAYADALDRALRRRPRDGPR